MQVKSLAIIILSASLLITLFSQLTYMPGPRSLYWLAYSATGIFQLGLLSNIIVFPLSIICIVIDGIMNKGRKLGRLGQVALVLVAIPFIMLPVMFSIGSGLKDNSIKIAIRHAQPIVDSIEKYKHVNGNYPDTLMLDEYPTGVVGLERYYYEKYSLDDSSTCYNVWFEYPEVFMLEHTVFYDPNDHAVNRGGPRYSKTGYPHWFNCIED